MHGLTIALAATILLAGPAAAQRTTPGSVALAAQPGRCAPTAGIADYRGQRVMPRKLGEMPPATQIYTVYTVVDGCPQPIVVRKGIGGDPQRPAPMRRTPPRFTRGN